MADGTALPVPDTSLAPTTKPILLKRPDKAWQWGAHNKGGRPKAFRDIKELGQRWTPEIMRGVILTALKLREAETLTPAEAMVALQAAKLALAYSVGMPSQPVELTGKEGGPLQLQVQAVAVQLQESLSLLAQRQGVPVPDGVQPLAPTVIDITPGTPHRNGAGG